MKEILLQGGSLNRCTLCGAKREKNKYEQKSKFYFVHSGDFPEFLISESLALQMTAGILDCRVCFLCRVVISYGR